MKATHSVALWDTHSAAKWAKRKVELTENIPAAHLVAHSVGRMAVYLGLMMVVEWGVRSAAWRDLWWVAQKVNMKVVNLEIRLAVTTAESLVVQMAELTAARLVARKVGGRVGSKASVKVENWVMNLVEMSAELSAARMVVTKEKHLVDTKVS